MTSKEDALYRLRLAKEHLDDARFEISHNRFAKAVMSAQLAVENAGKAVISLFFVTVKSHDLAGDLLDLQKEFRGKKDRETLMQLASYAQKLGFREHIMASYGDEVALRTPDEIYDKQKAKRAVEIANTSVNISESLMSKKIAGRKTT